MLPDHNIVCATRRFAVVERTVTRRDGQAARLQFVVHPGSVAILPIIDGERICLIRSRRLTVNDTLVEVPAGTREPNEEPIATARRELAEETGYVAGRLELLTSFYPSPGISNERMWVYVAHDLTAGPPAREANEEIENLVVSWDEALAMVDSGEICDAKTLLAILKWERKQVAAEPRED